MSYSSGYDDALIAQFRRRSLAESAGFFIPHLHGEMHLLDCGCGPGTLSAAFAEIVAQVVGLDIEAEQVTSARRDYVRDNLRFLNGNVYDLPFPPAVFDALYSQAMLYHLVAPVDALREMRRVLKPGGIIGIRDSDFGGTLIYPQNPLVIHASDLLGKLIEAHNGDPAFGRKQRAMLRAAGFQEVRVSASFDIHSTPEAIGAFCDYLSAHLTRHASLLAAHRWTNATELQHITNALAVWREHPDALVMLCRCEAVATAPASED